MDQVLPFPFLGQSHLHMGAMSDSVSGQVSDMLTRIT